MANAAGGGGWGGLAPHSTSQGASAPTGLSVENSLTVSNSPDSELLPCLLFSSGRWFTAARRACPEVLRWGGGHPLTVRIAGQLIFTPRSSHGGQFTFPPTDLDLAGDMLCPVGCLWTGRELSAFPQRNAPSDASAVNLSGMRPE